MNFLNIVRVNLKRMIKNPALLVFLVILPVMIAVTINGFNSNGHKTKLDLINNDKSVESRELIQALENDYNVNLIESYSKEESREDGSNLVLILEKGYGEKIQKGEVPKVKIENRISDSKNVAIEENISMIIKEEVENSILKNNDIAVSNVKIIEQKVEMPMGSIILMMMIYFFFIASQLINEDLLKLKKENVLKRALTTANDSRTVLVATFLGIYIFISIVGILVYLALTAFGVFKDISVWNGILAVLVSNLLFVSINIFIVRWFKNPKIVTSIGMIITVILFFLGIGGVVANLLSENLMFLENIAVISPFYWVSKIAMGDNIQGTIVIILMTIAVFTTGSYRLKDFVSNN